MSDFLGKVGEYYSRKLRLHGATPSGVDWNGEEGQRLRFRQLAKVFPESGGFSVCDVGCGYGAMAGYLADCFAGGQYCGIDVSDAMIEAASRNYPGVEFLVGSEIPRRVDFAVASGIFNVRLDVGEPEWGGYVERTLEHFHSRTERGFAFNCLTSYSDQDRMREDLFYPDPTILFDFCKRRFGRYVALLHDYPLFEFTILVRK